jgi:hypothetical protein
MIPEAPQSSENIFRGSAVTAISSTLPSALRIKLRDKYNEQNKHESMRRLRKDRALGGFEPVEEAIRKLLRSIARFMLRQSHLT